MNREQVIQTLAILKAAYPHSFQKLTKMEAEAMIALWERQFESEDARAVSVAIDNLIASRTVGYSPTIGEVKEQIQKLRNSEQMNEAQAWFLVEKACQRGLYNSREEFEKLPPDIQAAVGGPEQLRAWAMMDAETVNSVVASNFRKTYRTVQQRENEKAMMPPTVQNFLSEVAEKMALPTPKKEPAMLPVPLEPMKAMPKVELPKVEPKPTYKPPSGEEWAKKREEAMNRLLGNMP